MPFTLSHAAAILPFRRLRLVASALVIGTFAPDFEYFFMVVPMDRYGHTPIGVFFLTLPLALVVLWIFHNFIKRPAAMLLPDSVQCRLHQYLGEFEFRGLGRFLLIVISILLGIVTHLVWDSFTHRTGWFFHHWHLLRESVVVPVLGSIPYYKLFQHVSTVLGLAILAVWLVWWYTKTPPSGQPLAGAPSHSRRLAIVAGLITIACIVAVIRGTVEALGPTGRMNYREFVIDAVVTVVATLWWELVAYGVFFEWTESTKRRALHRLDAIVEPDRPRQGPTV